MKKNKHEIDFNYLTGLFILEDMNKNLKFNSFDKNDLNKVLLREKKLNYMFENVYIDKY